MSIPFQIQLQCDRKEVIKVIFLLNAFIVLIFKIGKQKNTRKGIPFIYLYKYLHIFTVTARCDQYQSIQ